MIVSTATTLTLFLTVSLPAAPTALATAEAALQEVADTGPASCDTALPEARRAYEIGLFDDVLVNVDICLGVAATRTERVEAYALQAKTLVVLDRLSEARIAIEHLIRWNSEYRATAEDPPIFVSELRRAKLSLVRSVSGFLEDSREAPATVIVLTAEEIERRGYTDLEQVLHDLPGFDISRGNGDTYSIIYQRGYRSNATDRTLLIIDGVEQNDMHSNIVYLSRQYPLSNIDRIEVVYGPASTIYGPNAYSGVINVITKDPDTFVAENRTYAARLNVSAGSYNTQYFDATVARRPSDGDISWTLTARGFRSDEQDLTQRADVAGRQAWWFDMRGIFRDFDYRDFTRLEGFTLESYLADPAARALLENAASEPEPLVEFSYDDLGELEEILLTDAGVARARELDGSLLDRDPRVSRFSFADPTRDWYVAGKLKFGGFSLGAEVWRRDEGSSPWYVNTARGSNEDGVASWAPRHATLFSRYDRVLGNWRIGFYGHYRNHQTEEDSTIPLQATYASGYLDMLDLIEGRAPLYREFTFDQVSSQYRAELKGVYEPSTHWNAVVGVDLRDSSIQADFFGIGDEFPAPEGPGRSFSYFPRLTPEEVKATDLAGYAQMTLNLWPAAGGKEQLKFVAGGRVDYNDVRENERVTVQPLKSSPPEVVPIDDYGTSFNPRVAVVFAPARSQDPDRFWLLSGSWVVKLVAAKATQQPPNFQRFAIEPGTRELPSPFLDKEEAVSWELSFDWDVNDRIAADSFTTRVVYFNVDYDAVLQTAIKIDPCCVPTRNGRFETVGGFSMWGFEATSSWERSLYRLWANYTYTKGFNNEAPRDPFGERLLSEITGEPVGSLRIGDIARHQLNFGVNVASLGLGLVDSAFLDDFNVNLRVNAVGDRRVGIDTTSRFIPVDVIPSYWVGHLTVGYQSAGVATFQVIVNNLWNADYWDPGARLAGQFGLASSFPQPRTSVMARAVFNFGTSAER